MNRIDVHFMSGQVWLAILICVVFWGAVYLYYRRTTPPLGAVMRSVLIGLRALAIAALFVSLAQPIISFTTTSSVKKRLALLLDRSGSMSRPLISPDGVTRLEKADEILEGSALSSLKGNLQIDYFSFAESLDVSPKGINLSGRESNPGLALEQIRKLSLPQPYDYLMLLSDGRATIGEEPSDAARKLGIPVYTIAVGDSSRQTDLALDEVLYDEVVYVGRSAEIKGMVSQNGDFPGQVTAQLRNGKSVLGQKNFAPPGSGRTGEFAIDFTPTTPGKLILDLEIASARVEATTQNNRRKFAVRVLKSKLNVLLYSSSLNQEIAYLKRFLTGQSNYDVTLAIEAPGGERLGTRFPATTEELNRYDVVILIDPNLGRFNDRYDRIRSYLSDRGGGVLLLMGEEYLRSAAGSRLADLSPLAVAQRGQRAMYGKFHLTPDPRMIFHPTLKLGETRDDISSAWANQPPFTMALPIDSVCSSGAALGYLEGEFNRGRGAAMASRRFGPGKLLAVAVSPWWHWAFYPVGVGGDASIYQNFFASTIRWLTISDDSERISFGPEKEVFQSGEAIRFSGRIHDEGFRPLENGSGDLIIFDEKKDSSVIRILPKAGRPGEYQAEAGSLSPGIYTYRADLSAESVRLGRFEGTFAIDDIDRETAYANVDWNSLAQTAKNTGGVFASYRDLAPIIDAINTERRVVSQKHDIRLWDNWIVMLIILLSLSVEWFFRKQRQLL